MHAAFVLRAVDIEPEPVRERTRHGRQAAHVIHDYGVILLARARERWCFRIDVRQSPRQQTG